MKRIIIEINDDTYEAICKTMEMTKELRREDSLASHVFVSIYNGTLIDDEGKILPKMHVDISKGFNGDCPRCGRSVLGGVKNVTCWHCGANLIWKNGKWDEE